jgi:hypothetical protein
MFAMPMQIDGVGPVDIVLGSKGPGAKVGWLQAPVMPNLAAWKWNPISDAGWIMSLHQHDIDRDGDQDIVLSDRKGKQSGCYWLENPGLAGELTSSWRRHPIVGVGAEVMFMDIADIDGDSLQDVVTAVRGGDIHLAMRRPGKSPTWDYATIQMPEGVGTGKAVGVSDINNDGQADLVVTCENAFDKIGVFWLQKDRDSQWKPHDISGSMYGTKFDRIEFLDLDQDGDQDMITCEERDNLGVIWYENPTR